MTIIIIVGLILIFLIFLWKSSEMIIHQSRYVSSITPDQFDLEYEDISFKTEDNLTLKAWFIPSKENKGTIIVAHGWGCDKGMHLQSVLFLHKAGYNLLLFDFRGHGESEGKYTSLGYHEVKDIKAACDYLKNKGETKIGALGFSMGATVAFLAQAENSDLKAVVGDSGYVSMLSGVASFAKSLYKAPKYPFIPLACFVASKRLGFDYHHLDLSKYMDKISPRAIFVIHGEKDKEISVQDAKAIYGASREPKQLWIVEKARHLESYFIAKEEYERRVVEFFDKYLK